MVGGNSHTTKPGFGEAPGDLRDEGKRDPRY